MATPLRKMQHKFAPCAGPNIIKFSLPVKNTISMNQFPVRRKTNHFFIRCKYRKAWEQSLVPEGCPGQFYQILCCMPKLVRFSFFKRN